MEYEDFAFRGNKGENGYRKFTTELQKAETSLGNLLEFVERNKDKVNLFEIEGLYLFLHIQTDKVDALLKEAKNGKV
jgi:hypothetical protein